MQQMITSTSNQHVAALHALHQAKGRAAAGQFLLEGPHLLTEALDAHVVPALVLFDPAALERTAEGRRTLARVAEAGALGAVTLEASPQAIARASETQTPQGIVAAVASREVAAERVRQRRRGRTRPLLLVLDRLADAGNLGTVLRSALAADVDEVLLLAGTADPLAPKVVRAASGAHFHLPVRVGLSWAEVAERLRGAPLVHQVLVAEADGRTAYDQCDLSQRTALIIGNEAHGPAAEASSLATHRISIPMWNRVESLNAGVAASVILFEAARQRRAREAARPHDDETTATTERVGAADAQGPTATD